MNTAEAVARGDGASEADLDLIFPKTPPSASEGGDGRNWSAAQAGTRLPRNGHVAIILRGQPFRWKYFDAPPSVRRPDGPLPEGGGGPNGGRPKRLSASAWASHTCHPGAAATQLRCAQSLV